MRRDDSVFPFRLATRLLNEFQIGAGSALLRLFDGDVTRAYIFASIARRGAVADDRTAAAVSINTLAASLARPFETVRRHVHALAATGFCAIDPAGVVLAPQGEAAARFAVFEHAQRALLERLVTDLVVAGLTFPPPGRATPPDAGRIAAAAFDLQLYGIEFNAPQNHSWTELLVLGATMVLNIRHITRDLALSWRFGFSETVPPMSERQPVPIAAVARELGLPYPTVRRHALELVAQGRMAAYPDGVVLSVDWIADPAVVETARDLVRYMRRQLLALVAAGFDPAAATDRQG